MPGDFRLIVVSGLSGSGKSVALRVLEDLGYYCIDNLPAGLLISAVDEIRQGSEQSRIAVGVDARNHTRNLKQLPDLLHGLRETGFSTDIIFLHASDETLLQRYSESRRRHPLAVPGKQLRTAIKSERRVLAEIELSADLVIDTSSTSIYELADAIRSRVDRRKVDTVSVLVESFGFKFGIPADADFVFDLRSLPNPYWTMKLRGLNGLDTEVQEFLDAQELFGKMYDDIRTFLTQWVPHYSAAHRGYMTIALGCTGGQHRSVYMAEKIAASLREFHDPVETRHNALSKGPPTRD